MRSLCVALLLSEAALLAVAHYWPALSSAAPSGTLDQLVVDLELRLDSVLVGQSRPAGSLARLDLAFSLRPGPGVGRGLAQVVRRLLIGKLAGKGLRSFSELDAGGGSADLERRARRSGHELLLDLELLLVEGQLHLQGDVIATDRLLWRDLRQPERGVLNHLHASVRVDAEVRAFQGSLATSSSRFSHQSFSLSGRQALALAAGDVDGDGRAELVLLSSGSVEVFRQRAGGFSLLGRVALAGTPAAVRPRRPFGTLLVRDLDRDKRAEVLARSSELEKSVELRFDGKSLSLRRELDGYPLLIDETGALLVGAAQPGQDLLSAGTLRRLPLGTAPLAGESAVPWQQRLPAAFYTLQTALVPGPQAKRFWASVDGSGQLSLFGGSGATPLLNLPRVGVAFDLCDLDDDGQLEIITSAGEGLEVEDQITVMRLAQPAAGQTQLRPLWHSPSLGGPVAAFAHGDLDGNGRLELVAAIQQKGLLQLMVIH